MSATILPTMGQQEEGGAPQVAIAENPSAQEQVERALPVKDIQPASKNTAPIVEPDVYHQAQSRSLPMVEDYIEMQAQHGGTGGQAPETSKSASEIGFIPTMRSIIDRHNEDRARDSIMDREHNIDIEGQRQFGEDRDREQRRPAERSSSQEQERAVPHHQSLQGVMYHPEQRSRDEDDNANTQAHEVAQDLGSKPSLHHLRQHPDPEEANNTIRDGHREVPDHEDSLLDPSEDSGSRHRARGMEADERMGSPELAQKDPTANTNVGHDTAVKSRDDDMVVSKSEDQEMPLRAPTTARSASPPASASIQPQARRHSAIDHGLSRKTDKAPPPAKRATTDSEQCAPNAKVARVKRELGKKLPKVYPPRKPRVRPAPVEPLTMTIRTDSALSTLASAAVAIKNHQGPLSTLSVPQSPTVQAGGGASVATAEVLPGSTNSTTTATTSTPGATAAAEETEAATASATTTATSTSTVTAAAAAEPPLISGRSPFKEHLPQDAAGYRCELCPGERFGRVHDLKRHQISKHNEMTWPCDFCHRPFVRRDALLRHYSVKAARNDGVHPTLQEEDRLQEAKARAKLLS
ncbi:hypothetical protein BGZ72_011183 [Mortierella alpina]|nr:hypothetical protein BGZ72_011183 [Mortierella alpina]